MKITALILMCFGPLLIFPQTNEYIQLFEINEEIYVIGLEEGYRKVVTISGSCNSETEYFFIQLNKSDSLETISATYTTGKGRTRKLGEEEMFHSAFAPNSEYSEYEIVKVYLPRTSRFEIKYDISNLSLPHLTSLQMDAKYTVDKITKTVYVPKDMQFHYELLTSPDKNHTMVETTENPEYAKWSFITTPMSNKQDELLFCHHPYYFPDVFLLFSGYDETPEKRLNTWLIESQNNMVPFSGQSKEFVDQLTEGLITENEITAKCFEYLQTSLNNVNVVDCQFSPEPINTNQVLFKEKGNSCETAFLLMDMLRHKGVAAYYALTFPSDYTSRLDFVCPASFGRAVCAANINGKILALDATDKYGNFGKPSIFTQGQMMFVTSEDGPKILPIPYTSSEENQIRISMDLNGDPNLNGTFQMLIEGQANEHYSYISGNWKKTDYKKFFKRYLRLFDGPNVSDIYIDENDTGRSIKASLNLQSYLLKVRNAVLLNPAFLPKPYFIEPAKKDDGTYIGLPFAMDVLIECTINFDDISILPEPKYVDLSTGNINCFYRIDQINDKQIKIAVGFVCNDLEILPDEMNTFSSIDDKLKKLYQHGIKID